MGECREQGVERGKEWGRNKAWWMEDSRREGEVEAKEGRRKEGKMKGRGNGL